MTAMGTPCKGTEVGSTPTAACFFGPLGVVRDQKLLNSSGRDLGPAGDPRAGRFRK